MTRRQRASAGRPSARWRPAAAAACAVAGTPARRCLSRGHARTWTSATLMWQVSRHHQSSLGCSMHPTSASASSPLDPSTSVVPRCQVTPSAERATPAPQAWAGFAVDGMSAPAAAGRACGRGRGSGAQAAPTTPAVLTNAAGRRHDARHVRHRLRGAGVPHVPALVIVADVAAHLRKARDGVVARACCERLLHRGPCSSGAHAPGGAVHTPAPRATPLHSSGSTRIKLCAGCNWLHAAAPAGADTHHWAAHCRLVPGARLARAKNQAIGGQSGRNRCRGSLQQECHQSQRSQPFAGSRAPRRRPHTSERSARALPRRCKPAGLVLRDALAMASCVLLLLSSIVPRSEDRRPPRAERGDQQAALVWLAAVRIHRSLLRLPGMRGDRG